VPRGTFIKKKDTRLKGKEGGIQSGKRYIKSQKRQKHKEEGKRLKTRREKNSVSNRFSEEWRSGREGSFRKKRPSMIRDHPYSKNAFHPNNPLQFKSIARL